MSKLTIIAVALLLHVTAWSQITEVLTIPAPPGGDFAEGSLCFVPDANGDGVADILVGSPRDGNSGVDAGRVTMFSGADGNVIFDVLGPTAQQAFGIDVDVLSDITGDGAAEVIVGSQCATWPSCGGSTMARILDGATGVQLFSVSGNSVDFFGISVAGIPDISGDGLADFIVASSDDNCAGTDSGMVFAYSGSDGQPIYTHCSGVAWGRFGIHGIGGIGDVDADSIGDWISSACECPGSQDGFARIVSGASGATVLQYSVGGAAEAFISPAAAGDINGDGIGDFYVGDQNPGRLHAVSGATGQALWIYPHEVNAIRALPDMDGDGVPDVCGAVVLTTAYHLLSGATGTLIGSITSPGFGIAGPKSMDAAGDVTGDGIGDLAIVDHASDLVRVFQLVVHDCNSNGIHDDLDISSGTSVDCNLDGVPDECEIAADPSLDFNQNGVLDVCECVTANYCSAAPNSAGTIASMSWQGLLTLSDNNFTLSATGAAPLKPGIFFYGPGQVQLPIGEGFLCIGSGTQRLAPTVFTDQQGNAALPIDMTTPPFSGGPFTVTPFSTWNFQFWYRDPLGGPAGFNFSDGLEVTFCP